ncbi:phage tail protein [Paenibacillus mucilaginosus]|uniref:Tail collar domain-containing protein n=2 Tax=Paenibacillus mucilaginosus TaxID=61624 RepID=H6NRM2_9BACL|nr:tail fiber protein [Paenibacillus mucilaginosus]AEI39002.1 tail collar domain-containing protein [Paenibacillus mucilaginosus KNP414]AFC27304.1 tail collar domain-containing protein [Paenibacillus mucilaginosus 3016]MCG7216138.1 tail fiber protein [Paenibacillus mucilaginosus]WDM28043.1 phage tail protein [Paenibacillus mucilaginosus]WFA16218.1 phage tail protein [Paenibacillus mucilaginosus]
MSEDFIGEIRAFSFGYAPRGWMPCNGQLLAINLNQALFSILGTYYGGNGQTNFALPDLRGRVPVHVGTDITLGMIAGEEAHTLTLNELPSHTHQIMASSSEASTNQPAGAVWAKQTAAGYDTAAPNTVMGSAALSSAGSSQPHTNMQPYGVVQFCICVEGIYPSRN